MTSLFVFLSCLQDRNLDSLSMLKRELAVHREVMDRQGSLSAKIVVVDELAQFPVAYTDFDLIGPDPRTVQTIRTDGEGKVDLSLDPGLYAFQSKEPLTFRGKKFTWSTSFEIAANQKTSLTLTNVDAVVEAEKTPRPKVDRLSPESRIFQQYQSSVVTVECDSGSGSGFVVDSDRGLILTTFHIAGASQFLSVRFSRQNHYEAKFLIGDPDADVALIRVNPEILSRIPSVPIVPSRRVGIEGERVVAMGSPVFKQTTITQGILSKVEDDVLISDVSLDRGNSGGPILNLEGQVIGVATFGDALKPGDSGATSIVSIRKADRLLHSVGKLDGSTLPSAEKLPDNSPVTIPPAMLEKVALSIKGGEPYLKTPKNFRTYLKTPFEAYLNVARYKNFLKEKIARRYQGKVPADQNLEMGPLYFWNKYVGDQFEPVVSIEVIPWPQEAGGSLISRLAAAAAGQHLKERREMRDDFTKMILFRNGVEVAPILRKRLRDTEIYDTRDVVMRDTALAGFYTYDPSVFNPGSKLELHVWKNAETKPTIIRIPADYQKRIWSEFKEWFRLGG